MGESYTIKEVVSPVGYQIASQIEILAEEEMDLKITSLDQLSLERRTGIVTKNPMWIVSVAILILVGFLAGRTHKPR